jgi:hypothetical protein
MNIERIERPHEANIVTLSSAIAAAITIARRRRRRRDSVGEGDRKRSGDWLSVFIG